MGGGGEGQNLFHGNMVEVEIVIAGIHHLKGLAGKELLAGRHTHDADHVALVDDGVGQRTAGLAVYALHDVGAGDPRLIVLPQDVVLVLEPQLVGVAGELIDALQLQRAVVQAVDGLALLLH